MRCEHCLCIVLVLVLGVNNVARAAWLRCYNGTLNSFLVTPLSNPSPAAFTRCLDRSLPTVVYTFGYRGKVDGPATTAVLGAYLSTKKRNVVLVDWEREAESGLWGIPMGYMLSAVPNAKRIGYELGDTLLKLTSAGLNTTQVHLVGHSLGAHIMAYAGRRARENGYVVSRITGLDPARALFEGSFGLSGLDRTCARFVDIIHSDPGGYGTSKPSGTVDIWPNYAGNGGMQPGCPDGDFDMFSPQDLCNHDRSWRYFVEALARPTAFPASAASDFNTWIARRGRSASTIFMGELTNTRATGNYFLTTNPSAPYGKSIEGMEPDNFHLRRRRHNSTVSRMLKYLR